MIIDYAKKSKTDRYKLMSQTIIPRPIAWIVTQNKKGVINIAPFSYFTGLSSEPPTVIVSIGHKSDGSQKDSLKNIRENKKCTICIVDEAHLEQMHFSSKELSEDKSEAKIFDIKTQQVIDDFPPMVEGVPTAFFCEFYQEVELKGSKTIPLILEIKEQFIDESILTNKDKLSIDFEPIGRVGKSYTKIQNTIIPPNIP